MPDMCVPSIGPLGLVGNWCPAMCPTVCGPDMMMCPGGADPNGCMMPDLCMPMGTECMTMMG